LSGGIIYFPGKSDPLVCFDFSPAQVIPFLKNCREAFEEGNTGEIVRVSYTRQPFHHCLHRSSRVEDIVDEEDVTSRSKCSYVKGAKMPHPIDLFFISRKREVEQVFYLVKPNQQTAKSESSSPYHDVAIERGTLFGERIGKNLHSLKHLTPTKHWIPPLLPPWVGTWEVSAS
jgi:hypothetical protein